MNLKDAVRDRVSSPERPGATRHLGLVRQPPEKPTGDGPSAPPQQQEDQRPHSSDPVKQDQIWREYVQTEMRGVREWEKNWSFLKNYDQLGRPRAKEPLPTYVSLFSDQVPSTTGQMLGSRMSTPLAREMMRLDRLVRWAGGRRSKPDPELLPG
ncbi:hypothetical protein CRUP_025621 [Coryphaenoides rupestris]|nr:hypothetical protein CRUP_025621 [Coryphaenoides rupestris]